MKKQLVLYCIIAVFLISKELWALDTSSTSNTGYNVKYNQKDMDAKVDKLLKALDMTHWVDSIEIDWTDWGTCKSKTVSIPGSSFCFDEPLYVGDYSQESLKVQSLGIRFGHAPEKNGYSRHSEDAMHGFGWNNVIKFPILGLVVDSPMLCMERGDISIPYLSFLDPTYSGIFAGIAFADVFAMFNPSTIYLGAIDCAAASVRGYTDTTSTTGESIDYLRIGIPHYFGCWNTFPAGGFGHSPDPIIKGVTASTYGLATLMRSGIVPKTTKLEGLDGNMFPDTMCGEKISPQGLVKTQFYYSLVEPGVSEVVPLGASPAEWAEFKNDPEAGDQSIYWIWTRRCIYLGAASCGK